jgi:hypothetical protein
MAGLPIFEIRQGACSLREQESSPRAFFFLSSQSRIIVTTSLQRLR